MDKKISRVIARRLRDLRRARGRHLNLVDVYEAEFKGAINILWSLDMISREEWKRLYDVASKFALATSGVSWPAIKKQYGQYPVSTFISEKVIQDEPEQVSAPASSGQLSVLGLLDESGAESPAAQRTDVASGLLGECFYVIEVHDDIKPNRIDFPRLGKHWAPASLLVGYQERKGHSVLRA
jgi:hypothetical protein